MLPTCCPRKLKLLLSKKQRVIVLKVAFIVSVFSLYFLVLIKESMNVMESKTKTVNALKVDNVSTTRFFFLFFVFVWKLQSLLGSLDGNSKHVVEHESTFKWGRETIETFFFCTRRRKKLVHSSFIIIRCSSKCAHTIGIAKEHDDESLKMHTIERGKKMKKWESSTGFEKCTNHAAERGGEKDNRLSSYPLAHISLQAGEENYVIFTRETDSLLCVGTHSEREN